MGGDHSLYVRVTSTEELRATIPAWLDVTYDRGCSFARIANAEDWTELARSLSAGDGEAIELGFQSVVDAFRFVHWSRGHVVRELVCGWLAEERIWERVRGTPEGWERALGEVPRAGTSSTLDAREAARAVGEHYKLTSWYEPVARR